MTDCDDDKKKRVRSTSVSEQIMTLPFKLMAKGAGYLIKKKLNVQKTGAEFAEPSDYAEFLNAHNTGLLLNGDDLRLSERDSFQNVCVTARIGAGKTTSYIVPNVLDKAKRRCSIIVNDPKGEVFSDTSAYMKKCGYQVIVIDPENLVRSHRFNPLMEARNDIEIEQVAEILVRAGTPSKGGKDDFWIQGAIRFVSLFIKCLKIAGEEDPSLYNLHNLYYLFQNFGEDGSKLDDFMTKYTIVPENPTDQTLWNEWKGVLTGNKEGVQSFVLNAITSLRALSNQNIAQLTETSDIQLEDIRNQKTIIYMITPAQHAEYYSFLTSLFFRSAFNACMRKMPERKTLPVYFLYDEFGHSIIPNFVSTANTIRGYKVSLSIILQSISQLDAKYGEENANAMLGGFNTFLTFSGSDPKTVQFFESIIGHVRERQREKFFGIQQDYNEYNLMNADDVRRLQSDQLLIVSSNQQPIITEVTPWYENWRLKRQVKMGSCELNTENKSTQLKYVGL